MSLIFQWNKDKAASNLEKHGVSFEEAATAFGDALSMTIPDPLHSEGETRFLLIGMTRARRIVVVAHTERDKRDFRRARKRAEVSVGESVRIVRELQGLSQNELSKLKGIPQSTISSIENDRVNLGVERAKVIARVLKCHPAVLVFPGWEIDSESAA